MQLPTAPSLRRTGGGMLALAAALTLASGVAAAPAVDFAAGTVSASGITPGGTVIVFSVSREVVPWMGRVVPRAEMLVDSDGDGVIDYLPDGPLANRSVWAIVDLTSGQVTVDGPAEDPPAAVVLDSQDILTMLTSAGYLVDGRPSLELLVVRPGNGAWHGAAFDGTASDHGAADDGAVAVDLSGLAELTLMASAKGTTLTTVKPGDVVVGIDSTELCFYAFVVPGNAKA